MILSNKYWGLRIQSKLWIIHIDYKSSEWAHIYKRFPLQIYFNYILGPGMSITASNADYILLWCHPGCSPKLQPQPRSQAMTGWRPTSYDGRGEQTPATLSAYSVSFLLQCDLWIWCMFYHENPLRLAITSDFFPLYCGNETSFSSFHFNCWWVNN